MTRPVMIATPCTDMMPTVSAICHSRLRLPPGSETHWRAGGGTIASKREALVQEFLGEPRFGSLLFLDSDMTYPSDLVERLQRHQRQVVSGMCFQRGAPYNPTALATADLLFTEFDGQLHECWATGTGCLLIQREVMASLTRPYFEDGHFGAAGMGEDYFLCRKIAAAGFTIWLDTSLSIGHVGQVEVTIDFLEMWLRHQQRHGRPGSVMTVR